VKLRMDVAEGALSARLATQRPCKGRSHKQGGVTMFVVEKYGLMLYATSTTDFELTPEMMLLAALDKESAKLLQEEPEVYHETE
jgi:hypothetical protein